MRPRTAARSGGRPHLALGLLAAWFLPGCATDPMPEVRRAYARGDYLWARDQLAQLQRSDPSNAHVYALERSVTELALGNPGSAEAELRRARDRLDDLAGTSAAQWLGSVLLDDRQLDYGGADYEQVLVRAMLAVANLMRDGRDADAYALQVLERQLAIMNSFEHAGRRPKLRYKLVAFGSYLRGILNEEDPLRVGVAREAFTRVVELEPGCAPGREGLRRCNEGRHSAKGNGVVHVLCLVGRGPFRIEVEERATRDILAIAQVIWAIHRDRVTFPNISSVKVPALAFHRDNPTEVHVTANGRPAGATEIVTDVDATAHAEFTAMHDHIVAGGVGGGAFKIAITEGAKEIVNPDRRDRRANPWIDLGISLVGLAWTAAEQADLRCWSLLPATFQVLRLELPAGEHQITLRAGRGGIPVGPPQTVRVHVRDGFNSYVVGQLPTWNGGPPPLTSEPADAGTIQ